MLAKELIESVHLTDSTDRLMLADEMDDESQAALLRSLDVPLWYESEDGKFYELEEEDDGHPNSGWHEYELIYRGKRYQVYVEPDDCAGPPWEESGCHGPVSDWTQRSKRPGEVVLCKDKYQFQYYDMAEAQKIALRDGWGPRTSVEGESRRQRAARAAGEDFEYLKRWCDDEWHYVCVVVERGDETASICGVESHATKYIEELARDLAKEMAALTEKE